MVSGALLTATPNSPERLQATSPDRTVLGCLGVQLRASPKVLHTRDPSNIFEDAEVLQCKKSFSFWIPTGKRSRGSVQIHGNVAPLKPAETSHGRRSEQCKVGNAFIV